MTPSCSRRRGAARGAVLAALGATAAIAVLAATLLLVRGPATKPDPEVGRAVAESFLELVRVGKPTEAWDSTSAEFKSLQGRESFVRSLGKKDSWKDPLSFVSTQDVVVQDQPRAEYLYQTPKGKLVRVLVANERGAWKVDRLAY